LNSRFSLKPYYVVFTIAGAPALLYQVSWQRVLSLYFGVDIYSTAVTVAAFMAGLGLGSMVGGRFADRARHPARVYAVIETALGLFGALSLTLFSIVGKSLAGQPLGVVATASFALLVIPTMLMGMTLPFMSKILVTDRFIGTPIARLYGLNTLGAAVGALIASYYLVGRFGLQGTVYLAAATNVLLGLVVWRLSSIAAAPEVQVPATASVATDSKAPLGLIIILAAASGFVALGYELVWYRMLTVLLHGTVYVFGTILFVYLMGIAAGALAARRTVERDKPLLRFARAQLVMSAYVLIFFTVLGRASGLPGLRHLIAASFFTSFHPSPELASGDLSMFAMYSLLDIPFWAVAMLGVPTFAMGYGFTQLMRAATSSAAVVGTKIGQVYFANIVGATVGSLLVGFVLLEHLGSENTLLVLALTGLAVCFMASIPMRRVRREGVFAMAAAAMGLAIFPAGGQLIRALHLADFSAVDFVAHEDRTGVVALRSQSEVIAFSQESKVVGQTRLYIDGASHGHGDDEPGKTSVDPAVRLAMALEPQPRRLLSIGLGDGVMCATAVADPNVSELIIVELNAGLSEILQRTRRGQIIASSPKVRFVTDDGRRWLLANPDEKFDLIMMFPLHAAHGYYGNLYSREFFELIVDHLNPAGTLVARSVDLFSTAKTLAAVFNHVIRVDRFSYLAGNVPLRFDADRLPFPAAEFEQFVEAERKTIELHTADAPLNLDLRPNSEYYLTYPFAWTLASQIPPERFYTERDRARFLELINGSKPALDTPLPTAATHPSE
jgi:spermidine synthase